jgi:hypothetical protein
MMISIPIDTYVDINIRKHNIPHFAPLLKNDVFSKSGESGMLMNKNIAQRRYTKDENEHTETSKGIADSHHERTRQQSPQ